ncbi:MAG: flagellar protein export ATPase FliI [Chromatiales bacterium]
MNLVVEGKLTRMVGLTLEAAGCQAAIGDRCRIASRNGAPVEAEVVGFGGDRLFLMPTGSPDGLAPDARVVPIGRAGDVAVGEQLLGRVIDGAGSPLDGKRAPRTQARVPLQGTPINPLARTLIRQPLDVGVRAINALFAVGGGQRLGLFAPTGAGKSILLGMMTRYTSADVIVVGLIGERGREVKEFIEESLGPDGLRRAVVVATPADMPPLMRVHGAALATAVAEYFRDRGLRVLLLMDSLTRYAQALREIALTIGEPPATRGYPPSVFARLPALVERAGTGREGAGSITAFYTVLTDAEDANDPLADAARAILDGHIILSRRLAESGHYPAIDIEASVSRVMRQIVSPEQEQYARTFRHWYSLHEQNRDLLNVGAYKAGSNADLDRAIAVQPQLQAFLRQDMREKVSMAETLEQLRAVINVGQTG